MALADIERKIFTPNTLASLEDINYNLQIAELYSQFFKSYVPSEVASQIKPINVIDNNSLFMPSVLNSRFEDISENVSRIAASINGNPNGWQSFKDVNIPLNNLTSNTLLTSQGLNENFYYALRQFSSICIRLHARPNFVFYLDLQFQDRYFYNGTSYNSFMGMEFPIGYNSYGPGALGPIYNPNNKAILQWNNELKPLGGTENTYFTESPDEEASYTVNIGGEISCTILAPDGFNYSVQLGRYVSNTPIEYYYDSITRTFWRRLYSNSNLYEQVEYIPTYTKVRNADWYYQYIKLVPPGENEHFFYLSSGYEVNLQYHFIVEEGELYNSGQMVPPPDYQLTSPFFAVRSV